MALFDRDPSDRFIGGLKHGWIALIVLLLAIALGLIVLPSDLPQQQLTRLVRYLFTGFFALGTAYGIVWLAFTYLYPDIAVEYDFQFPVAAAGNPKLYYEVESRLELSLQRIIPYLVTIGMAIGAVWVWTSV